MNSVNLVLQKPKHLVSLASSAVLVAVDVKVWSATKQDRSISDEVTSAKKADKNSGRFVKNILADNPKHKAVVNYRQTVYNWMKRRTYPWSHSQDLLPSTDIPTFMVEYRAHEAAFHDLLDKFCKDYSSIVSDMAFKQGDMFDRNDYPDVNVVQSKFAISLFLADVPMYDFRCGIAQDLADDLFNTYSNQAATIVNTLMSEQADRFTDVMESISFCCGLDDTGVDKHGDPKTKKRKIYDTTIQRAKEMCETFKGFNVSGSNELEEARAALEITLNGVTASDIRESDAVRESVKSDIDNILSKFSSFKCV